VVAWAVRQLLGVFATASKRSSADGRRALSASTRWICTRCFKVASTCARYYAENCDELLKRIERSFQ
jgi:phosphoribosyl-dephospho-CoA transferase